MTKLAFFSLAVGLLAVPPGARAEEAAEASTAQKAFPAVDVYTKTKSIIAQVHGEELRGAAKELADAKGVLDKALLAKAVYDYAQTVARIDRDVRNFEAMLDKLPEGPDKTLLLADYMVKKNKGHLMNYDDIRRIVFDGADIAVSVTREVVAQAGAGPLNLAIESVEVGQAVIAILGDKMSDKEAVKKVLEERLVKDAFDRTVVLNDQQMEKLQGAEGATLQDKYDDTFIAFEDKLVWLTPEMKKILEAFAQQNELDKEGKMGWKDLYSLYSKEKREAEAADAEEAPPAEAAPSDDEKRRRWERIAEAVKRAAEANAAATGYTPPKK